MFDDPLAGRGLRVPERSRMLVATEDGVFLWPGTALVYRRGNGFFTLEPRELNSAIGCLFGPSALDLPFPPILERARDELRCGRIAIVQEMLDRLSLPPVSPNGASLMRAIAERQGLSPQVVPVADRQDGTVWSEIDASAFARFYDGLSLRARSLEKTFNPGSAWDPAKHPRWPSGETDGGEFAPVGGEDSGSQIVPVAGPRSPWSRKPQKPLGDPPKVPETEPITQAAKYLAIRTVAYWLIRAAAAGSEIVAPEVVAPVMAAVEAATWLAPYVKSYFNPPETLVELQQAVDDPQPGTDTHHIAEQTSAANDGFPRSQIDDPSNLVQIPTLKHWQLNWWFQNPNPLYGNVAPRDYVKGKDWATRTQVGLQGLREVGVLK
jgi:hypothetical protein